MIKLIKMSYLLITIHLSLVTISSLDIPSNLEEYNNYFLQYIHKQQCLPSYTEQFGRCTCPAGFYRGANVGNCTFINPEESQTFEIEMEFPLSTKEISTLVQLNNVFYNFDSYFYNMFGGWAGWVYLLTRSLYIIDFR